VPTREKLHGSPVYSKKHDVLVVGTNDSTVLVVKASTGKVERLLKVGGPVKYHCALAGDLAVFGSFDGKIYIWDFVRDEIKLEVQTEDIVYSRPLICDDIAFVGCADHTLRIIDLGGFSEVHKIDVGEKIHSSPALIGSNVVFGTSAGELIALDRFSFDIKYRLQFPERLTNTTLWHEGMLYIYAFDNKMWAVTL